MTTTPDYRRTKKRKERVRDEVWAEKLRAGMWRRGRHPGGFGRSGCLGAGEWQDREVRCASGRAREEDHEDRRRVAQAAADDVVRRPAPGGDGAGVHRRILG